MNKEETVSLDTALSKLGVAMNFSVMIYKNKLDKKGTQLAKDVGKKFLNLLEELNSDNFEFSSGMDDFEHLGPVSYLAIKHVDSDTPLLFIATPQEFVDIEYEEKGEEDEGT